LQATTSYPVENSVNSYLHSIIGGSDISEGTMDELMKRLGFKCGIKTEWTSELSCIFREST